MAILLNCWAANFDSSKSVYVNCGSDSIFNFHPEQNSFSIQAWIKPLTTANGFLIARGLTSAIQYGVKIQSDKVISYIGNESFLDSPTTLLGIFITNGNWHHLVYTIDAANKKLRIYIDGQLLNVHDYTGNATAVADLLIGAKRDTSNLDTNGFYDGQIDEVGIWSKELTSAEVVALYNGGAGLMLDQDSGNYTSSDKLEAWWRMGDGSTENAGTPSVTATIADESGHFRHAKVYFTGYDLDSFYVGNAPDTVVGEQYCFTLVSSSAVYPDLGPSFTIIRKDQGNLKDVVGFEGNVFRTVLECVSTEGVDNKIFVYEWGRPIPGTTLRSSVFRRVASLRDMATIPADRPEPIYPFAFRTNIAEIYAPSATDLDNVWQEIQKQATLLSFDMQEFGAVTTAGTFQLPGKSASEVARGAFKAIVLPPEGKSSSSSSLSLPSILSSSSSSAFIPILKSSSSSAFVEKLPKSSSSSYYFVDPHLFSNVEIFIEDPSTDAVSIYNNAGVKTLISNMGFIRVGRNLDPEQTWDTYLKFKPQLPKCANILKAELHLVSRSSESGEDVILKINEIYEDSSLNSVQSILSTTKKFFVKNSIPWIYLTPIPMPPEDKELTPIPDITDLLQSFVNRANYDPNNDYFGLWIQEVVSDPGARRDANLELSFFWPKIVVTYRDDSSCSSSSAAI